MAIQLKIIQDTVFKQTTEDSAALPPEDKVTVAAGTILDIHSWKTLNQTHIRVALLRDSFGEPPRNTWCVYIPHIQLIQPPSIKITQDTVFKQSTQSSSQLPPEDKADVAAGRVFYLHSWATASNDHYKLSLTWNELGNPPRNTWYAYAPHIQFINTQAQVVPLPGTPPISGGLPATKQLNVPHKSQLDNALNPTGACNVTSFAMVMSYFQIRGNTNWKMSYIGTWKGKD